MYRMDKQQGPTVQHRELYSISCDNLQLKRIYMCMNHFSVEQKLINMINQLYVNKNF